MVVARKLRPISTKTSNHGLEVAKKKMQKREKLVERQKTKAIAAKHQRNKEELVCLVKRKRIMRLILKIIQI